MKRFIQDYLLENWTLKAIAILLAVILWLFVRGEPSVERVVRVPLEVQLPRGMEIINDSPATIEITMRGTSFSNMVLNQPLPTCIVKLQEAKEGEHVVTISPDNVKLPRGSAIEVTQVNPERVTLVLEKTISKEVPIIVPVRGDLPPEFEIYTKASRPAAVTITGPRSHVERIHEVLTEAIPVNGQKPSIHSLANLNIKDSKIRTSLANPVQVEVRSGPRRRLHTIRHIPVVVDDAAYSAAPKQISVQVFASPDSINKLAPADFSATVAAKDLDSTKMPVKAKPLVRLLNDLDGTVILKEIQPPEVVVHLNK